MKFSKRQALAAVAAMMSMAVAVVATAQTTGGGQAPYVAVDRPAIVTAIPGVVAAGARWKPYSLQSNSRMASSEARTAAS